MTGVVVVGCSAALLSASLSSIVDVSEAVTGG